MPILQQLRPGPNHGRASSAVPPMCPAGSTFLNVRGPARLFERCADPAHGQALRCPGARSSAARPRRTVERRAASAHGRALRGPGARSSAARPRRTVERCATVERRAAQEHGRALRGPGARLLRRMRYKTSCSSWGWLPKYVPTVGRRPTVGSVCHVPTSVCLYHTNAREMMRSSCQA